MSNLLPILKNIQIQNNLLPIQTSLKIKYDLLTIYKYLEIYKEFLLKLSSYILNASTIPGPLFIIDDIITDIENLKIFSESFKKSLENVKNLTASSLNQLLSENQESFSKALQNILKVVEVLSFKKPLKEDEVSAQLSIIVDSYSIRNLLANSTETYMNLEKKVNFLLNKFTSLVNLQTALKSSVSTFGDDLVSWKKKMMRSINIFESRYVKLMNEELKSFQLKVRAIQEEIFLLEDSSAIFVTSSIIENLQNFSNNHQARITSANTSISPAMTILLSFLAILSVFYLNAIIFILKNLYHYLKHVNAIL